MLHSTQESDFRRSVLVVEDEALLRELIVTALEERGLDVVAAGTAADAARAFRALNPDGIVMDIDLGVGPNGFDLAERFLADETGVAILFLTNLPDARFAGRTPDDLPPGIAYLRKNAVSEVGVLVEALDAAMRGTVNERMRHDMDPGRPLASLNRRQIEILRLVALGKTNAQIAELRGTTVKPVERAIARAFAAAGMEVESDGNIRVNAARRFMRLSGHPLSLPRDNGEGA